MDFKSNPLQPLIEAMNTLNDDLGKARDQFLRLKAQKDFKRGMLTKAAEGKSHAEKLANAMATQDWFEFSRDLARAESVYEWKKLKLEILMTEHQDHYLLWKQEAPVIKRQS